jgi:lipoprotein NlpD
MIQPRTSNQTRFVRLSGTVLLAVIAAACSSNKGSVPSQAPVEDRGTSVSGMSRTVPVSGSAAVVKPPPGVENAGKPGYYTVKPGDTLIRVGLDSGQNWRDIVRWNGIENPNLIEVGQVLRVVPPSKDTPVVEKTDPKLGTDADTVVRPLGEPTVSDAPRTVVNQSAQKPAQQPAQQTVMADDFAIAWPAQGNVVAGFDEAKNKGLDIAGKLGDPVSAVADGRVVYAGSGLRGYGNLIIIKHNDTYLTAYAHNQTLLVKEDQSVRKGQKIAEMGQSDADRVKLHFEVRKQGKPVDPLKYLPAK